MTILALFIITILMWLTDLYVVFIAEERTNVGISSTGLTIGFWHYSTVGGIIALVSCIIICTIALELAEKRKEKELLQEADEEDYQ